MERGDRWSRRRQAARTHHIAARRTRLDAARRSARVDLMDCPTYPGADHYLFGRYTNGEGTRSMSASRSMAVSVRARRSSGYGIGVLRADDRWLARRRWCSIWQGGSVKRIVAPGPVERIVASWYRIGGSHDRGPAARQDRDDDDAAGRAATRRAVALHVSARSACPAMTPRRAMITRFLAAAGPPERVIAGRGRPASSAVWLIDSPSDFARSFVDSSDRVSALAMASSAPCPSWPACAASGSRPASRVGDGVRISRSWPSEHRDRCVKRQREASASDPPRNNANRTDTLLTVACQMLCAMRKAT